MGFGMSGALVTRNVANPAAGSGFVYNNPARVRARIRGLKCILTCSAVVGNRLVSIFIKDAAGVVVSQFSSSGAVVASSVTGFAGPSSSAGLTGVNMIAFPDGVVVPPGGSVASSTPGFDVADQWSSINFLMEEVTQ